MSQIRACTSADIPRVADLFHTIFRKSSGPAPASLRQYLLELFLEVPWRDPELPSLVYTAPDGRVGGFIGVIPLRMSFRGQPIRVALTSSIMVEKPEDDPLAGARLLRAVLSGPQDLTISDDSNSISVAMWKKLGGKSVPLESMDWLRVLRPAGFALSTARERIPIAGLAHPICRGIDSIALRARSNRFRVDTERMARSVDLDLSDESLFSQLREFAGTYSLGPAWDNENLRWLLQHAARNRRHGKLVCRAVYWKAATPVGCYLYYHRPAGVAHALQVMASPGTAGIVLDSLLDDAQQNRCVAVRGRTHSRYIDELFSRDCIFFNRGSVVVHSRNADVVEAARSGDALMTGLAGEAWTRIAGGDIFN